MDEFDGFSGFKGFIGYGEGILNTDSGCNEIGCTEENWDF
jgi:hypothetical protein